MLRSHPTPSLPPPRSLNLVSLTQDSDAATPPRTPKATLGALLEPDSDVATNSLGLPLVRCEHVSIPIRTRLPVTHVLHHLSPCRLVPFLPLPSHRLSPTLPRSPSQQTTAPPPRAPPHAPPPPASPSPRRPRRPCLLSAPPPAATPAPAPRSPATPLPKAHRTDHPLRRTAPLRWS